VPDDATRVVYLDAANALQLATSFPTNLSTFLPLATVVAAGGTLAVTDERVLTLFTVG
jgi:hypothetical protein